MYHLVTIKLMMVILFYAKQKIRDFLPYFSFKQDTIITTIPRNIKNNEQQLAKKMIGSNVINHEHINIPMNLRKIKVNCKMKTNVIKFFINSPLF